MSRINESFQHLTYYPGALKFIIKNYIDQVFNGEFEVKKLYPDDIDIYCERIELKDRNEFENFNEFQMCPIKKQVLVFHVNINIVSKQNAGRSFDWNGSPKSLEAVYDFLIRSCYINTIDFRVLINAF